ncbi:NAD(P)-dependent dehydrogenase, short-chain alcohol dehydrogenase family [Mesobacillus persicus]|uniref:NAD(P)-dependent dehydrogenase, short-chain alcohol dehydrogenase family n=1 Tax=Mesobacillus persicus TaxID=930146 RepID=A0A1H8DEK4_9BACI|nr:SDR family oxidoreductase [Mesobacillus persicus]SEN05254.1 NAD(P)-dependent dehydrogenase, short-chain alcohol dehydrogenase family [Mesobacillus persicus]
MSNSNNQENQNLFPPQHQEEHPGMEYKMDPLPVFDDQKYIGSDKLKDKVALITGGDSGIGRAVALAFAKEGADIVFVYYNEEKDAEKTEELIKATGRRCLAISGDIADESFCKQVVADTIQTFGKLNVLVNNAAVQYVQNGLENISTEQMLRTFQVNIFGMFFLTKAALAHMKQNSSIINTTSLSAYEGNPQLIDYSATKGAIVSFTRSLSKSLAPKGIRVNGVAPGKVWTPLIPSSFPADQVAKWGSKTAMKRAGQPVEFGPAYVYLASNDSSYVTGQILHLNGGLFVTS